MKRILLTFLLCYLICRMAQAQYAPAAGEPGSTAIHRDSAVFVSWASHSLVARGYIKISDTALTYDGSNLPTLGTDTSALGYADGVVVSLGDGGEAVLGFDKPVYDGEGPDFAVFENGFPAVEEPFQYFLELGFVEVSSDSMRWVRFPAYSETDAFVQKGAFDQMDPAQIHNLAGKYEVFYGTPFDLEDIRDSTGIDTDSISWVRIVDVVGCIHSPFATMDVQGNMINDPWPTPFHSGGFDLDAVGVIHSGEPTLSANQGIRAPSFSLYPNPVRTDQILFVSFDKHKSSAGPLSASIFNSTGLVVVDETFMNQELMELKIPINLHPGIYFLCLRNDRTGITKKLIVIAE